MSTTGRRSRGCDRGRGRGGRADLLRQRRAAEKRRREEDAELCGFDGLEGIPMVVTAARTRHSRARRARTSDQGGLGEVADATATERQPELAIRDDVAHQSAPANCTTESRRFEESAVDVGLSTPRETRQHANLRRAPTGFLEEDEERCTAGGREEAGGTTLHYATEEEVGDIDVENVHDIVSPGSAVRQEHGNAPGDNQMQYSLSEDHERVGRSVGDDVCHGSDASSLSDTEEDKCGNAEAGEAATADEHSDVTVDEDTIEQFRSEPVPDELLPREKKFVINNSFLLYGILARSGSRRLTKVAYETVSEALSIGVSNSDLLKDIGWRSGAVENPWNPDLPLSQVTVSARTHVLPSRATINRVIPDVLGNMTLPLKMVRVRVNTAKIGAEAVARHYAEKEHSGTASGHDQNPACEVGIVLVSEIVKADVLNAPLWRAMNSNEAIQEMDRTPFMNCRDELYGPNASIDAIRPLHPSFKSSLDEKGTTPDGTWRWTHCGVGEIVEVRATNKLKDCLQRRLKLCAECVAEARGPASGDEYFFGEPQAISISDETSCIGRISVVWNVGGASSWADVNQFCGIIGRHRAQVVQRMIRRTETGTSLHASEGSSDPEQVGDGFRFKAADNVSGANLLLALLLSRAAQTRAYSGATTPPLARPRDEPQVVPWSPVKPGDTVAMLSIPEGVNDVCPCMSCPEADNSCILIINRWWRDAGEHERQFTFVPDVSAAVESITKTSVDRDKREDCPFGSSAATTNDVGPVVIHPAAERRAGDSVGSTRARVTALWNSRTSAVQGAKSDFGGRDGHVTAAIRKRMHDAAPTRGFTKDKAGNDVPYFRYRGYGYHDGFIKEAGRDASACGLYWGCLNLPASRRRCSGHVRVVSLCPPGTDVRDLYKVFFDDIMESAVNGIECVTAEGQKMLVFLDLVCILGDTPAVTEVLDVRGHQSAFPCHFCNYMLESEAGMDVYGKGKSGRAKARRGARFTDTLSNALLRTSGRSMYVHQAVRDAVQGTRRVHGNLKALGLKPDISTTVEADRGSCSARAGPDSAGRDDPQEDDMFASSPLPLHEFARSYERAALRKQLPHDAAGRPILPSFFCPYRGCPPVPEHLLCGVFKDSVNAALGMFRKRKDVNAVDKYFAMYHEACGIVVQSRYVNARDPVLNKMKLTNLYALSIVAERALLAVANSPNRSPLTKKTEEEGILDSIAVVGSAAGLIAAFWKNPLEHEGDGLEFVENFGSRVSRHLALVHELCRAPAVDTASAMQVDHEEDDFDSQPATRGRGRRPGRGRSRQKPLQAPASAAAGNKTDCDSHKTCDAIARDILDCPNTHRLMELATLLPFLRHGHFVAELPCETKHQPMKRLLEQFHGQVAPHVLAVKFSLLDDFKGRLCSLYEGALRSLSEKDGLENYVRGMLPLLFGRDCLAQDCKTVSEATVLRVQNIIGLAEFVPSYLNRNFLSLMTNIRRCDSHERGKELCWKVGHKIHRKAAKRSVLSAQVVRTLLQATKVLCHATDVLDWPGIVALSDNDDEPAGKFASGQHEFLRKIEIGSVISCRVRESWCNGETSRTLFHVMPAPSRAVGTPSDGNDSGRDCEEAGPGASARAFERYFCVDDIFTLSHGASRAPKARAASTRVDGVCVGGEASERYDRVPIMAVVREVLDSVSGEPVSADGIRYQNALCVRSSAGNGEVQAVVSDLWPYYILRLDGCDAGIRPVAVLTKCEATDGCWAYESRARDAELKLRHGERCGPRHGGEFFIRDAKSGFPHRSA